MNNSDHKTTTAGTDDPITKCSKKPEVAGIICEYNPFHNGHAYHIGMTKKVCGADYVIAVMSGDFTQRGDPAVTDKYARTRMALANGCDMVIELPVRYATASAEGFAYGAVNTFAATSIVDSICFGCECESTSGSVDLSVMKKAAELIDSEPEDYKNTLTAHLKNGLSYPAAREQALNKAGIDISYTPNNILALEYIRACRHTGIKPYSIQRKGSLYNDCTLPSEKDINYASAAAIREDLFALQKSTEPIASNNMIRSDVRDRFSSFIPENIYEIDTNLFRYPVKKDHFSLIMLSALLSKKTHLYSYLDISDDLARRIDNNLSKYKSWGSFVDLIKTRQYTYTRINRGLLHCMLDISGTNGISDPADAAARYPASYIRVLGFRKDASILMKLIKEYSVLPVITKPSEMKAFIREATSDSNDPYSKTADNILSEDLHAEELYRHTRNSVYGIDLPQCKEIIIM